MIKDTSRHTMELIRWIEDRLNKEILAAKKDETKKRRQQEKTELMRFYRSNAGQIKLIFDLHNLIVDAKIMVVRKLQQMRQVTGTFLRTDDGFKVTNAEGFVAVSKTTGGAVKLVDRMVFAHANFNAAKNWSK
jgi:hypothetical protein